MPATHAAGSLLPLIQKDYIRRVPIGKNLRPHDIDRAISWFRVLEGRDKDLPIIIAIDSNGGDYPASQKLIDVIQASGVTVYGLAEGFCLSSAFCIMQACTYRLARPHAQ